MTLDQPALESDGLLLRAPGVADVPAVVAACQDPDIQRWTLVPSPYRERDGHEWISQAARAWTEGIGAHFVVTSTAGELLGSVGLGRIELGSAEVGYWLAEEARGHGVATRAVGVLARWALGELGLARLGLIADVDNVASQRVAERAGFQREGVMRQALVNKGRRSDCVLYSLLRSDLERTR